MTEVGSGAGRPEAPQNPLHERYASAAMARLFASRHRCLTWRRMWIHLAEAQAHLGLPISDRQLDALRRHEDDLDLYRVAQIERETRHDVVAHLRHFAEVSGDAGNILHLGATSAFITDNADALMIREALDLVAARLAATAMALAGFARRERATTALAYTHFQSAQLTTLGKRACLWLQDFLTDLDEVTQRRRRLRCRGAKGTTGTQASFLTLFGGDHGKVRELDARIASALGFESSWPVTGQTYPRKQDSQVLHALAGVAESCHKFGSDVRLLQGVGELSEPFDHTQVGSSAMAYKRNPVRTERMCSLSRRIMTDSLHGALNAGTQWLERSLDDSANRRLVLTDSFLTVDAVLLLAANVADGLRVNGTAAAARVNRELPFMATETFLMEASLRGGNRQHLHERIRQHSLEAWARVSAGEPNPLLDLIAADSDFGLDRDELASLVDADAFTGRSARQVDEYLAEVVEPALRAQSPAAVEAPRV